VLPRQFLEPLNKVAAFYPNLYDPNGTPLNVVAKYDGTFEAISNHRHIPLRPEDVQLHRWNIRLFRNHIAQALGIEPSDNRLTSNDRLILLGDYRLSRSEKYPVYWLRANDYTDFQGGLLHLALNRKSPFFLLTGSQCHWDLKTQDKLHEMNSPLLALSEILEFRDGQFTATDVWYGAVEAFRQALHPENMVAAPPYEFRKVGQGWVIRFDGNETFIKDGIGPIYISLLLRKPYIPIFASDLQAIAAGQQPEHSQRVSSGDKTDATTLEQIHQRYNKLVAELEVARRRGHNSHLETEIRDEIEKLMNYLADATGWNGYVKKEIDEAEKIRQAAYRAIQRTIILLEELLPQCAEHLENAISTGFTVNYQPTTPIEWVL